MEWEKKVEMVKLQNDQDGLLDFAVENHKEFDGQAWDMFANCAEIIVSEFQTRKEQWEKIWPELKKVDCNDEAFGFRTGMRVAMMQTICEEELKFN